MDNGIAALAVRHSVPLISNNLAHFERVPGLVLISEAMVLYAPSSCTGTRRMGLAKGTSKSSATWMNHENTRRNRSLFA